MSTKHHRIVVEIECLDEQGTKQAVDRVRRWLHTFGRDAQTHGFSFVGEPRTARSDLSDCSVETIRELLIDRIQETFDDPGGAISSDKGLAKWLEELQALAKCIGLNWRETVLKVTSVSERNNMLLALQEQREIENAE